MKIIYIVSGIKRSVFFENTALQLAKKGHDVSYILICNESNDFEKFLIANNFKVKVIVVKSLLYYLTYLLKIYLEIKKHKPLIVHTHLTTANIIGLLAAKLARVKYCIFTEHSGLVTKVDWKQKVFRALTSANATSAIAITKNVKNLLIKRRYKPNTIEVINYGFNIKRFQNTESIVTEGLQLKYNPQKKYPVIGVISRCVEWKGLKYTISAFKNLINDYPNALLLLFNYDELEVYSKIINNQLSTLPESSYKKIKFESNVYDLYCLFDVFVHVPVNPFCEAFGQVYVESLASGIPSVFTLSGIATDFIKNKVNALTVNFRDSNAIYEQIKLILTDSDLKEKIIKNEK